MMMIVPAKERAAFSLMLHLSPTFAAILHCVDAKAASAPATPSRWPFSLSSAASLIRCFDATRR